MHYTSVENIHKVIDPLFLNELRTESNKIQNMSVASQRREAAEKFRDKIGNLKFFDPACGSGNFLTETYLSLRRMEDEVIRIIQGENTSLLLGGFKVSITNFYGIEINDFAVSVAKTAMWIAEAQTMQQSQNIGVYTDKDFFPLTTNTGIHEGNALRMDWTQIVKPYECNYVMGNPPFVGARLMSKDQKSDIEQIFKGVKGKGNLDYVAAWYKKAANYIQGTTTHCAFVSTNSITQGEQVAILWKPLMEQQGIVINFAYRTFIWDNEATKKAHVHCVIVGFSLVDNDNKIIYVGSDIQVRAKNINGYLLDANNIFIENRTNPISTQAPIARSGNKPIDGGFYLFTREEYQDFVSKEPNSKKYFKKWVGSREFITKKYRYCLWLGNADPTELSKMPLVLQRINLVKKYRLNSKSAGTRKLAKIPTHFHVETIPDGSFLVLPLTSSQRREYVPIGYMDPNYLASNLVLVVSDAKLSDFGVLTSSIFMSWMRAVCGRLKSDYRITKNNVYNNFPWPIIDEKQHDKIAKTAQGILDARKLYPDSSLADLYDPLTMPIELRRAHEANDKAVLQAYGLKPSSSEAEIVQHLFKMYEMLTAKTDK
ncbi:class I SAM-dependent DNA methyltransferase [Limosilactobacillus reuteri subsp. suis]|uniref:class I SAM-dependent DNA methyltransferase n=1 Tax=Limosilactobacillus reuteri TaxID=1598 RepID=UPI0039932693